MDELQHEQNTEPKGDWKTSIGRFLEYASDWQVADMTDDYYANDLANVFLDGMSDTYPRDPLDDADYDLLSA